MKIPVLNNHDHTKPIGEITEEGGRLILTLPGGLPEAHVFEIFGGVGMRVLEMSLVDGVRIIRTAELLEFSLCLQPVPVATEASSGARWHEEDKLIPFGGKPSETP